MSDNNFEKNDRRFTFTAGFCYKAASLSQDGSTRVQAQL
jgi:hypothetical protein